MYLNVCVCLWDCTIREYMVRHVSEEECVLCVCTNVCVCRGETESVCMSVFMCLKKCVCLCPVGKEEYVCKRD